MPRLAKLLLTLGCAAALAQTACAVVPTHALATEAGYSALERGDPDRAVAEARLALLARPDHEPAQILLLRAFRRSVERHSASIAAARRVLDWDRVVAGYRSLTEMDRLARPIFISSPRYSGVADLLVDRTDDLNLALGLAAETHYQAGLVLGAEAGKPRQRDAAREYARTVSYVEPYKDARERYLAARAAGTEDVAFAPFEDPSGAGLGSRVYRSLQAAYPVGGSRFEFVTVVAAGSPDLSVRGRLRDVASEISPVRDAYVQSRTRTERAAGRRRQVTSEVRGRERTTTVRATLAIRVVVPGSGREVWAGTYAAEASERQTWEVETERRSEEVEAPEDAESGLIAVLAELAMAVLSGSAADPGPADEGKLRREVAEDLAAQARRGLDTYFAGL
ncbi:MAG: hypothetical protein FJZ01_14740 [Candidatus Sericytochromatia bacterium]|nr:hypothetical protein [Candidatus Tanganyikabacteria bacterium]